MNKKSTVLRIPRTETDELTKDFAWEKANELDEVKRFIETSTIEHVRFTQCEGVYAILGIIAEPKDGKKKSGTKKTNRDEDDEQMTEMI